MPTTIDRDHYMETLDSLVVSARFDLRTATETVETAKKYALDGVHRAQLARAHKHLTEAQEVLKWVKP